MKRIIAFILAIVLIIFNSVPVLACDENQSDTHTLEILFGDDALSYSSDEKAEMLLDAVYICCEQSDNNGTDKLTYLKNHKVSKVPSISSINIENSELNDCAHICWESDYLANKKVRTNRKKVLQNTVNKVFDVGTFNKWFGSEKEKCDSFAALLYYSHILSDYLADNPEETSARINGKEVASYTGQAYIEINGGIPSFTSTQKQQRTSSTSFSNLDSYGRCGVAYAVLGYDILPSPNSRQNIGMIKPSGWNQEKYDGFVNSDPPYIFNRCHLIAHELAGNDGRENLITGTRYLNETGMKPFEDKIAQYVKRTQNHVLYRVTPVFNGDNLLASGVQMEAYSVEDKGEGICFNVYCYNVQPGVDINYASGKNEIADNICGSDTAIPFAISNPSDSNPDLIYEMNKYLEVLFEDQKKSGLYTTMMNDINSIAFEARSLGKIDEKPAQTYAKMKDCEFRYYQTLKQYVPMLLKNEEFFKTIFK